MIKRNLVIGVSAMVLTALTTGAANAQSSNAIDDEVIVTGVRASLAKALDQKRNSANIVDAITAEDIGDFPDLNIGEALQRVPGVTLDRSESGEGSQINIRGLPGNFVKTTLNGITAVNAGANGNDISRNFDFDVFASEIFSNITIAKTATAGQTEGGISGNVNLQTPRPFDLKKFEGLASISGQIASLGGTDGNDFSDINPRLTGLVSWTNENETLGATFTGAYTESSIRSDLAESFRFQNAGGAFLDNFLATDPTQADLDALGSTINGSPATIAGIEDLAANAFAPTLPRLGPQVFERERLGLTGTVQARPREDVTLTFDALYATFDDNFFRGTIDGLTGFGRNGQTPITINTEGDIITSGTFGNVSQRSETFDQDSNTDFYHLTAGAEWDISDEWSASALLGYSNSQEEELRLTYIAAFLGDFNFQFAGNGEIPEFNGVGFDVLDPTDFQLEQARIRPRDRESDEFSAQFDVTRRFDSVLQDVTFGGRYSDASFEQIRAEDRPSLAGLGDLTGVSQEIPVDGFLDGAPSGTVTNFLLFDPDLARAAFAPDAAITGATVDNLASFTIDEETIAFYVDSNWSLTDDVHINLGARVVTTDQQSRGTTAGGAVGATVITNQYTDFLPSLNAVVDLSDTQKLRFSAASTLSRPNIVDLNVGQNLQPTTLTGSSGNPLLDPFRANNYDLAYEWYFAPESLFSATVFYKDIGSFITSDVVSVIAGETSLTDDDGNNVSGSTFLLNQPVNGEGGEIYGLELVYQQPFTFLPAPFDGLGIQANVTLAESNAPLGVDGGTIQAELNGVSNVSGNLIGYYEKDRISLRVAYSYRDDFRNSFDFGSSDLAIVTDSRSQIDLSASYDLTDNFTLVFDGVNVNGEDQFNQNVGLNGGPINRNFFDQGAVYTFGVRGKF